MKTWLKTELHSHTVDDPEDGNRGVFHSAQHLIDHATDQGFQVLSITNHNQLLLTPSLKQYAEERGILLIPGVEATLGGKHCLLYNFLNYENKWDRLEDMAEAKGKDQLVIAPHPFFPLPTCLGTHILRHPGLFDAIEYNHFYLHWLNFNHKAVEIASKLHLPLVGNSDVHDLSQLGLTYSLVFAEKSVSSVLEAIKKGHVRLVTHPVSLMFMARWLGVQVVANSLFAAKNFASMRMPQLLAKLLTSVNQS